MKFICTNCIDEKLSDDPCILNLKGAKNLKYDRHGWKKALRRCPFENEANGKFTGESPVAEWRRKK